MLSATGRDNVTLVTVQGHYPPTGVPNLDLSHHAPRCGTHWRPSQNLIRDFITEGNWHLRAIISHLYSGEALGINGSVACVYGEEGAVRRWTVGWVSPGKTAWLPGGYGGRARDVYCWAWLSGRLMNSLLSGHSQLDGCQGQPQL